MREVENLAKTQPAARTRLPLHVIIPVVLVVAFLVSSVAGLIAAIRSTGANQVFWAVVAVGEIAMLSLVLAVWTRPE